MVIRIRATFWGVSGIESGKGAVRGRPRGLCGALSFLSDMAIWLLLDVLHCTSFFTDFATVWSGDSGAIAIFSQVVVQTLGPTTIIGVRSQL